MTEPLLDVLEGYAVGIKKGRAGVPLWYNKDKPGIPIKKRFLRFCGFHSDPFPCRILTANLVDSQEVFHYGQNRSRFHDSSGFLF